MKVNQSYWHLNGQYRRDENKWNNRMLTESCKTVRIGYVVE
jgi:hypothetical protein